MVVEGVAFQPQAQRVPVDRADHLGRHQRVAPQHARKRGAGEWPAFQLQMRIEFAFALAQHVHVHVEVVAGDAEAPVVTPLHRHEGRDVEGLGEIPAQHASPSLRGFARQHIGMAFLPWRVGDLGDDAVEGFAVRVVAVVEAHRVEHETGVAQVGKQPDRSDRTPPNRLFHALAHRLGQRQVDWAEVVAAAELGQVATTTRPQPATREHAIHLVQVEVELRHPVAEGMRMRREPAVAHRAFVHRAVQGGAHATASRGAIAVSAFQRASSAAATSTALRMPSS